MLPDDHVAVDTHKSFVGVSTVDVIVLSEAVLDYTLEGSFDAGYARVATVTERGHKTFDTPPDAFRIVPAAEPFVEVANFIFVVLKVFERDAYRMF